MVLAATPANAPQAAPATPFTAHLAAEYTLSVSALALMGILDGTVSQALGASLSCRTLDGGSRCDPAALWVLDRRSLGLRSLAWARLSDGGQDVAVAGSIMAVLLDAWLHHRGAAAHDMATDGLVLLESFAASTVVNHLLKYAVRRPRPQLYGPGGARGADSHLSFPSGHTAATASALTAWASIFAERHPHSQWRLAPYAVAAGMTVVVGYGRVAAPKHFPTDVLAAAVLGGALGYAIPKLHATWPKAHLTVGPMTSERFGPEMPRAYSAGAALRGRL